MSRPVTDSSSAPLLEVENLRTYFPVKRGLLSRTVGHVRAVDGVSLAVHPRQTVGLVGESGCGKSTLGRTVLRLIPATSGQVRFDGQDVLAAKGKQLRDLRLKMQIIFQDPVGSLNPRMRIGRMLAEVLEAHRIVDRSAVADRVSALLRRVGLTPDFAQRYPHEFSGGQRQRIGIARALALNPRFVVCDEPVSALDVSIQSQILNLLSDLKDELGLSYLFIAHNLAVVEHFCDQIAVMYLGRIVEYADRDSLYRQPRHPYSRALLSAAPMPDPTRKSARVVLSGEVPSPIHPPPGCAFHPRCDLTRQLASKQDDHAGDAPAAGAAVSITVQGQPVKVMRRCVDETPPLDPVESGSSHCAACWYADQNPAVL